LIGSTVFSRDLFQTISSTMYLIEYILLIGVLFPPSSPKQGAYKPSKKGTGRTSQLSNGESSQPSTQPRMVKPMSSVEVKAMSPTRAPTATKETGGDLETAT
jgi:hypothetical protein